MAYLDAMRTLVLALAVAVPASAGVVTYTDRTAWLAAAGTATTLDFESIAIPANPGFIFAGASYVTGGVTFTGSGSPVGAEGVYVVPAAYAPAIYDWGSGTSIHYQYAIPATLRATFGGPVAAAAFDFFAYLPTAGDGFTVRLSTGESFGETAGAQPNRGFFGMVTDAPVTWVEISAPDGYQFIGLDNLSFTDTPGAAAVPEPSSFWLAAAGMAVLARLRWRR